MLEIIKQSVAENYDLQTSSGIFFSLFDENKQLLLSKGVLFTDKNLDEVITTLYNWLLSKQTNVAWVGIDIILAPQIESNPQILSNLDMQKYWIGVHALQTGKMGVLLPATSWISSIGEALQSIKTKNWIEGDAEIYTFTTDRKLLKIG